MRHPRTAVIIVARFLPVLCLFLGGIASTGCSEDETDIPIISTATPVTAVSGDVDVEPEDAGVEEEEQDAGTDAGKKKGKGRLVDPFRIDRCCNALENNKSNALESQRPYYDLAINACNAARKNPALLFRVKQLLPTAPPVCQ
jgi:hypothetical protein